MKYLKASLLAGTVGGAVVLLWFLCVYWAGANPFFSFGGNLVLVAVGLVVFGSLYLYNRKHKDEPFSFGHGMVLGGATAIFTGIVAFLLTFGATEYIIPGAVETYKNESLTYLTKNKEKLIKDSGEEVYKAYLKGVDETNAFNSCLWFIIRNNIVPGLFFSFLTSLVLRRNAIGEKTLEQP